MQGSASQGASMAAPRPCLVLVLVLCLAALPPLAAAAPRRGGVAAPRAAGLPPLAAGSCLALPETPRGPQSGAALARPRSCLLLLELPAAAAHARSRLQRSAASLPAPAMRARWPETRYGRSRASAGTFFPASGRINDCKHRAKLHFKRKNAEDSTIDANFSYRLLEVESAENPGVWRTLKQSGDPVDQSALGTWQSSDEPNGLVTLRLTVEDLARNRSVVTRQVVTNNPDRDVIAPQVAIEYPQPGATLAGNQSVRAVASDNIGVTRVDLYLDGALYGSRSEAPYEFALPTFTLAAGGHELRARAYDGKGNEGLSAPVGFAVENFISALKATPAHFTPNGDGSEDTTLISAALASPDIWVISIRNAAGAEVQAFSGTGAAVAQMWDGKSATGALVPDGEYKVRLTVPGVAEAPEIPLSVESVDKPPIVQITAPKNREDLRGIVDVRGTVLDSSLQSWTLEYRMQDETSWTQIATGSGTAKDKVLGQFDTTTLMNDFYELRLRAVDGLGQTSQTVTRVSVVGELKLGVFIVSFTDLGIPLLGIPIVISRTYDSTTRNVQGDFGYGWRMDIQNGQIRENLNHDVFITLPDGRRTRFLFAPYRTSPTLNPNLYAPRFINEDGVYASLDYVGDHQLWKSGDNFFFFNEQGVFDVFDPETYLLSLVSGDRYTYSQTKGLKQVEDSNGNTLIYTPDSISHSSGRQITIHRDVLGRIDYISDPDGNKTSYDYATETGDLISVTDQMGSVTRYEYQAHYLLNIMGPDGVAQLRSEYDTHGRLIRQYDAHGNKVEFTHNPSARQEVLTDLMGNPSIYEYDNRGRITAITNALGARVEYHYDTHGNIISTSNWLGHRTIRTYDIRGNMTSETNPLGHTTNYTYDNRSKLLTITNALEQKVVNDVYDSRGNLTSRMNALGVAHQTNVYNTRGALTRSVDAAGRTTTYDYNAHGDAIRITQPGGRTLQLQYDTMGNATKILDTEGSIEIAYNKIGFPTYVHYGDGPSLLFEYDAAGNFVSVGDAQTSKVRHVRNRLGQIVESIYSDGTSTNYKYDAAGNKLEEINPEGERVRHVYNALGQVVRTIYADGTVFSTAYDAAGNPTLHTYPNGSTVGYEYDALMRVKAITNMDGNSTTYSYDAANRLESIVDSSLREMRFIRDAAGRLIRRIISDGSSISYEYNHLGLLVSMTDQQGASTRYSYDEHDRLSAVTSALGQKWIITHNARGKIVHITDPNGHSTRADYDSLGRLIKRWLADGVSSETFVYNDRGFLVCWVNANGKEVRYSYDSRDRLARKEYSDGSAVEFTYTPTGRLKTVIDERGTTSYSYDAMGRLVSVVQPSSGKISYAYNSVGQRSSVVTNGATRNFNYDIYGRVESFEDITVGKTMYSYDGLGKLASRTLPNGIVTSYSYDGLDRLNSIEHKTGAGVIIGGFQYSFDAVGNRTNVVEFNGSMVSWSYDSVGRLLSETRKNPEGIEEYQHHFHYDSVGNRIRFSDGIDSIDYKYDERDRLLLAGDTSYEWDDAGNLVSEYNSLKSATYSWSDEHLLRNVTIAAGGTSRRVDFAYDADGTRIGASSDDGATYRNFLIDKTGKYDRVVEELGTDGTPLTIYSHAAGELISQVKNGERRWFHADALGSVRIATNDRGEVTDRFDYEAFGRTYRRDGGSDVSFLFGGEQLDSSVGLYYLRARYLDPSNGRFLSSDPFSGIISEPLSLNKYLYAHANPVNLVDPTGRYATAKDTSAATAISSNLRAASFTPVRPIFHPPAEAIRWGVPMKWGWLLRLLVGAAAITGAVVLAPGEREFWIGWVEFATRLGIGDKHAYAYPAFECGRYALELGTKLRRRGQDAKRIFWWDYIYDMPLSDSSDYARLARAKYRGGLILAKPGFGVRGITGEPIADGVIRHDGVIVNLGGAEVVYDLNVPMGVPKWMWENYGYYMHLLRAGEDLTFFQLENYEYEGEVRIAPFLSSID
jgi:RHS repeat-associated protein